MLGGFELLEQPFIGMRFIPHEINLIDADLTTLFNIEVHDRITGLLIALDSIIDLYIRVAFFHVIGLDGVGSHTDLILVQSNPALDFALGSETCIRIGIITVKADTFYRVFGDEFKNHIDGLILGLFHAHFDKFEPPTAIERADRLIQERRIIIHARAQLNVTKNKLVTDRAETVELGNDAIDHRIGFSLLAECEGSRQKAREDACGGEQDGRKIAHLEVRVTGNVNV